MRWYLALVLISHSLLYAYSAVQLYSSQEPEEVVGDRNWSAWTPCNNKCMQARTRACGQGTCRGRKLREKRTCWRATGRCSKQHRQRFVARGLEDFVYELIFSSWSDWSPCTRSCVKRRTRSCTVRQFCSDTILVEEQRCRVKGSRCDKYEEEEHSGVTSQEDTSGSGRLEPKRKPDKKRGKTPSKVSGSGEIANLWNLSECGKRNVTVKSLRIVGGQQSQKGAWPWQVAILTRWKEQYCGGVLISPQHILTAAHCVRKRGKRRRVIIRINDYDLSYSEGLEQEYKSLRDIVHPDFDIDTIDSDIAILRLPEPVVMSTGMNYACVPEAGVVLPPKTLCYAVGWGKVRDTRLFGEDVLREARVPLVDRTTCQNAFDYEITVNQMCAGYRRGGVDTCAGDSGGPLMCEIEKDGEKQWYVYGVTSFGEGCGDRGKFGIYTRVSNFATWIEDTVNVDMP